MISKKFLKSSIMYTIAGALPMASAVILLPFYNYYLPVEEFGALAVYTAFSMLIQVIITYSFDSSVYIYFHEFKKDTQRLSIFISSAFLFMLAVGAVVFVIASATGSLLFDKLLANKAVSFYPYGFLSVATSVFQALFKVYSSLMQSREKPVLFFWSNLLSFSLIAGCTVGGLLLFPGTLVGPVGGRLLAAVASGIWVLINIFREFGFHFDFPLLRSSFSYNNSAFIYQLQQWLISYFDRLLMTFYLTLTDVGAYDFAFKCLLIIDFIIGGLYNSFFPKIISIVMDQKTKESTVTINRYYHGIVAVMMFLVCVCILCFPALVNTGLIRSGYKASLAYIPFMGLIYLARGIRYYFNFPYGALKYPQPLPLIYLLVSAVKIGLTLLFISSYHVYAVIGSSVVSGVIEIVLLRLAIKNKFRFRFNSLKLVVAPALLGLVIVAVESMGTIPQLTRHVFYLLFCCGLLAWLYRKELKLMMPVGIFR